MLSEERVIRSDNGNPLRIIARDNGGLLLLQGRSHLLLNRIELADLAQAITDHLARPCLQRFAAHTTQGTT